MVGKAKSFSDEKREAVYQAEIENETYSAAAQQNSYNLGSVQFSDQSGIGNFPQSGRDQRNAALKGALFRGNIGFDLQTCLLDVGTETIDLNNDSTGTVLDVISTDRFVTLSAGTTSDLTTITGAQRPGQRLRLYNTLTNTITIKHTAAATVNTIRTPTGEDIVFEGDAVIDLTFDITTAQWRVVSGPGGAGTGTFIAADMDQDQLANLALNDHIQFNQIINDGGIVLQGQTPTFDQTSGIFELKAGKTYYLYGDATAEFNGNPDTAKIAWWDRTNAVQLGRKGSSFPFTNATKISTKHSAQTIFTPTTDVDVDLRIVNLSGAITTIFFDDTQANIFEFSGINTGGAAPTISPTTWKIPARALQDANVPNLAAYTVLTDGVTLVQGDRVLLVGQDTQSENGLWEVGVVAAGVAPLTRPDDFDTDAEVLAETFTAIEEGTLYENQLWHLISDNPLTVDVSNQVWQQFGGAQSIGPDLGQDGEGFDNSGQFVFDGRIGIGYDKLKTWEKITNFPYPDNGTKDIIYLRSLFSNIPGRLVYVGDSNQAKNSSYSDDYGTTFQFGSGPISSNDNYIKMAYRPPDGTFTQGVLVAIASNSPNAARAIQRSTNRGDAWSNTLYAGSLLLTDILWSSVDSLFVLVDSTATTTNRIWTSPDGQNWTQQTTPAATVGGWRTLGYSSDLGKYFAYNTGTEVMESPDAINWTAVGPTNISLAGYAQVTWSVGQEKFAGIAPFGGAGINGVFVSEDGINFTKNSIPSAGDVRDLVWAPDLSLWVALGSDTTSLSVTPRMFHASNDLVNWYQMPINNLRNPDSASVPSQKSSITYAEEYGYFFATGRTATGSAPFTANADCFRTRVDFNNVI